MATVSSSKQPKTKPKLPKRRTSKKKTDSFPGSPDTRRQTVLPDYFIVTRSKSKSVGSKEQQTNAIIDGLLNKCEEGLEVAHITYALR
jgi:hypothetical protein